MMFEKVNPSHPDKVADRIAGAIVDLAYKKEINPKIAVEVLIGHNETTIICESSVEIAPIEAYEIVKRINGDVGKLNFKCVPQDAHLAENQNATIKCGDNGIFKGVPTNRVETKLSKIARAIYRLYPTDGKYILADNHLIICQSYADETLNKIYPKATINPLGNWTGGTNVDTGATNRKLGSDMGRCVTGGGLHGKDLSKADVSVNIYAFLKARQTGKPVTLYCAIGDEFIDGQPYAAIVEIAREYIRQIGGFEKFAEWGLI